MTIVRDATESICDFIKLNGFVEVTILYKHFCSKVVNKY